MEALDTRHPPTEHTGSSRLSAAARWLTTYADELRQLLQQWEDSDQDPERESELELVGYVCSFIELQCFPTTNLVYSA